MGKIKVLDERTRLKIAAGEVVQDPAAVVKELLENAIDANSRKIVINIRKGGKELIEIIDDGVGIASDDAELLFQRYSTSKISDIADLEAIQTLGFRGEALASIAAVSHIELITKTADESIGTRIIVQENKRVKEPAERANGTTLRVQNLFYNVPARLKFLKTSTAEFQLILEVVTHYSLFYHSIHFILTQDGTEILNSPAVSNPIDKLLYIYGKDVVKNMIPLTFVTDIIKIAGFISKPVIQRGTRKFYSIFVNKRLIKSKLISDAIDEAYKRIIPKNRYPIIVLSIEINPAMIDVNVHPSKKEIKISQEQLLFDTLRKVIWDSFDREKLIPKIEIKQKPILEEKKELVPPSTQKPVTIQTKLIPKTELPSAVEETKPVISEETSTTKLPPVEIIGQAHNLFIIAADNDNLYIIDQHAAHERIMFEKFLKSLEKGPIQMQTLLTPLTVEFPLQNSLVLQSKIDLLKDYGFELEPFGKNMYKLLKLPIILGKNIKKEEIQLLIDELLQKIDPLSKKLPSRIEIAQLYGCKAAIKAGAKLSLAQMKDLYHQLQQTDNPYVCAHNRPSIITFSKSELESKFHR